MTGHSLLLSNLESFWLPEKCGGIQSVINLTLTVNKFEADSV